MRPFGKLEAKNTSPPIMRGSWKWVMIAGLIFVGIVGIIYLCEFFGVFPDGKACGSTDTSGHPFPSDNLTTFRSKRGIGTQHSDGPGNHRKNLKEYIKLNMKKGVFLELPRGSTTTFQFDLCEVIECQGKDWSFREYNLYLCVDPVLRAGAYPLGPSQVSLPPFVQGEGGPGLALHPFSRGDEGYRLVRTPSCKWEHTTHYTGSWVPTAEGLQEPVREWWKNVTFQRDYSPRRNLISVSFQGQWGPPLYDFKEQNSTYYSFIIGADAVGRDPQGFAMIQFIDPFLVNHSNVVQNRRTPTPYQPEEREKVIAVDYTRLKPLDIIERATGYTDSNLWLDWLIQSAKEQNVGDCVACASGRPQLYTEPAPLYPDDTWGFECMLSLTKTPTPENCTNLASIFPVIDNNTKPGAFTPHSSDRYVCFNFTSSTPLKDYGRIDPEWCNLTYPVINENKTVRAGT
ncbi:uncharacterized protein LOC106526400 [Austrofundulus limnaeus]|uniref:Uncharacterized protein LOC106526400 n=1 Tax=Austrofundulus limnaeus TaxID=52670 RepID=A0A2I4C8X5_AUSLI|nr:PREDICTED: uncharacterized protein LOC106526400 [Austrofundulus limnaeus]